ncbi:MAG: hypothetical protein AAB295_06380 [Chloroflexota bacterium]
MLKVLFVNGPPGAGKDSVGKIAERLLSSVRICKFAKVLKERTHALYGLGRTPHDWYEGTKDEPHSEFLGLTPRQAYIAVAETYLKVQHGQRVFGEMLKRELIEADQLDPFNLLHVVTDSGFRHEAEVLVEHFGADRCALLRVKRPGYDFKKDSRGYIDLSDLGVRCISFHDCSDLKQLEQIAVLAFKQLDLMEDRPCASTS